MFKVIQQKRWIKEDTQIHALASLCAAYFSPKMMKSLKGGTYFKTMSTLSCYTLKICNMPYEVVPFFCNSPCTKCGLNYTNIKDATNVNRVEFDVISSGNALTNFLHFSWLRLRKSLFLDTWGLFYLGTISYQRNDI